MHLYQVRIHTLRWRHLPRGLPRQHARLVAVERLDNPRRRRVRHQREREPEQREAHRALRRQVCGQDPQPLDERRVVPRAPGVHHVVVAVGQRPRHLGGEPQPFGGGGRDGGRSFGGGGGAGAEDEVGEAKALLGNVPAEEVAADEAVFFVAAGEPAGEGADVALRAALGPLEDALDVALAALADFAGELLVAPRTRLDPLKEDARVPVAAACHEVSQHLEVLSDGRELRRRLRARRRRDGLRR
mmetsp:Transcript_14529/g.37095  ORF Transcript_14529/g.37095 Transcript_14529/m.37095 type:complete len:244 (+) Transcript_14529:881-1612(+)